MRTTPDIIVNIEVLTRYLAGEATPEEAMAVDDWRMASAENTALFAQLSRAWEVAGENNYQQPDLTARWQQFLQQPGMAVPPLRKRTFSLYKIAAAAIFLIAALVAGVLLFRHPVARLPQQVVVHTTHNMDTTVLPDRTTVVLCPQTSISHPPVFNSAAREVTMNGKAFFEVTSQVQHPFRISLGDIILEVIGTTFEVNNTATDSLITVSVVTGAVKLYSKKDTLLVRAAQTGTYNKIRKQFESMEGVNLNALAYATRSFDFNNLTLQEVAGYLESAYQVKIHFQQAATGQCRLSAAFDQQSLTYILDIIAATMGITYTIAGNQVDISGNGCN